MEIKVIFIRGRSAVTELSSQHKMQMVTTQWQRSRCTDFLGRGANFLLYV